MTTLTATLKTSVGATLSAVLTPAAARQIVKKGDATVTTPGVSGFDVVTLKNVTLDAAYTAATVGNPIHLGVDDILFLPLVYPATT